MIGQLALKFKVGFVGFVAKLFCDLSPSVLNASKS